MKASSGRCRLSLLRLRSRRAHWRCSRYTSTAGSCGSPVPAGNAADDAWARVMARTLGVTTEADIASPDTTLPVLVASLPALPPLAAATAAAAVAACLDNCCDGGR